MRDSVRHALGAARRDRGDLLLRGEAVTARDFEAEARAWLTASRTFRPLDELAALLAANDARARAEGYRRGVEAAAFICVDMARGFDQHIGIGCGNCARSLAERIRALLPPEPAKAAQCSFCGNVHEYGEICLASRHGARR